MTDQPSRRERLAAAVGKVSMLIEAIDQHGTGRRRAPDIDYDGEDAQLRDRRRLVGTALGRDLQRNVATFAGLMQQFVTSVVGATGPRLEPAPADEGGEAWTAEAAQWFRGWAKWCDGSDDTPFAELVSQALTAGKREGDILWVFDDFDRDDGTIRVYESDQMPTIAAKDWDAAGRADRRVFPWKEPNPDYVRGRSVPQYLPLVQKNGVVRDRSGRVHYYVCHPEHGRDSVKLSECSIVAAWNQRRNPKGSAKLYKQQWRKSYRGSPTATTFSTFQHDVYELVSHALQSAKRAHTLAGWTETDVASVTDPVEQALIRAGIDPEKVLELAERASSEGTTVEVESLSSLLLNRNYESMEKLTGGYWEYPNAGDKLHLEGSDQPGPNVEPFGNWLQAASGYALGLGRSRALGFAATAYTAFRGEELMSWATFTCDQKALERRLLDFAYQKAIDWAIRNGEISPPPAPTWQTWFRWSWPTMPEVDQLKAASARRIQLKNGEMSFSDLNGPDWRKVFEALAAQLELARRLDLPLSILETVSGSVIQPDGEADADPTKSTEVTDDEET